MRKNKLIPFILLLPIISLTFIVLLSVWNVIIQSLGYILSFGLDKLTLKYYLEVFGNKNFINALCVSLKTAFVSAILATVLGVVLCAALVKRKRTSGAIMYLVRLPILVPHAVVAVFIICLFAQTGLLARILNYVGLIASQNDFPKVLFTSGYYGVILAYLWKEIPFVAYFTLALMSSISDTLGEAAENLGASPLKSFLSVTLPLSMPAITNAFLIIFIFAFGGYELPLLLGATLPKALPVEAYLAYMSPDLLRRPFAMAINGVILVLSALMTFAYTLLTRRLIKKLGV